MPAVGDTRLKRNNGSCQRTRKIGTKPRNIRKKESERKKVFLIEEIMEQLFCLSFTHEKEFEGQHQK